MAALILWSNSTTVSLGQSLLRISSRKTTEYADYPMPAHYPDFPSRSQMVEYLRDYARHFSLRPHIEFGARRRTAGDSSYTVGRMMRLSIHGLMSFSIVPLRLSMFLGFAVAPPSPWGEVLAAGFGVGAGLTLDEFALWVRLEDVYWTKQGRASVDAVEPVAAG